MISRKNIFYLSNEFQSVRRCSLFKMKVLIFLIATALLKVACSVEVNNETARSADEITPQPLINLQVLKNNTKSAAERILNILKSDETTSLENLSHGPTEEPKKHNSFINHHFNKDPSFKHFSHNHHHHKQASLEKSEIPADTPLCICNPNTIPTYPSFATTSNFKGPSYLPTPPTSRNSFESRRIPSFETIPSNDFYSNSIETPIINHYSPLDFSNLYTFDSSDFK